MHALLLLPLFSACGPPELNIDLDSDMDGLLDDEERDLGTDPGLADTDGDGYDDGYEMDSYADPLNPLDHPLKGNWDLGECRFSITSTGNGVGDVAEDFALRDQFHEEDGFYEVVRLHDFCHKLVLINYCSWEDELCVGAATTDQQTYNTYRDRGFIVLHLLYDITSGEEAAEWAEDNGALTYPILVDDGGIGMRYEVDSVVPSYTLVGPGAVILVVDGTVTSADIEANLPG